MLVLATNANVELSFSTALQKSDTGQNTFENLQEIFELYLGNW